ncbi:unnamed protein product, partial [Ixodes persulcatus]
LPALQSTNSTEGSHSSSPSSLNAPRYGTMVPKRIFVGGISPTTTEAELHELFSRYGVVTNTKIIADRAGVSKGYGFVTFDSEEEAQRAQTSGANVMLRERRLNIAPAIKKQPFTRVYECCASSDPTQSVPNGTILYHNGIPYTYHNGMAFFVTPETAYQYSATSQTTTPATTTSSYPVVYQPSMYYPQHTAYQYQNVIPSQWNASSGQWRWAPPQSVGHPAYVYPTAAMMSMGGGIGGGDTSSEYQDPAIVETGTEVGALGLMLRKEDGGGGGGGGALTASMAAAVGLNSFCKSTLGSVGCCPSVRASCLAWSVHNLPRERIWSVLHEPMCKHCTLLVLSAPVWLGCGRLGLDSKLIPVSWESFHGGVHKRFIISFFSLIVSILCWLLTRWPFLLNGPLVVSLCM